MALVALSGCTSTSGGTETPGPSPSGATSAGSVGSAPCVPAAAKAAVQVLVSKTGFDSTCVKARAGKQFLFVNDSDAAQSLKTGSGSPESFRVDLPKRTSTYARTFSKKGTYEIEQLGGRTTLTLVIQ
ncbi:hypothetical protein ASD90_22285 [Terrabacter sp. Root181]|nr:hypothetical protein ASD90_22285 [Terrabacter sp. Root181]